MRRSVKRERESTRNRVSDEAKQQQHQLREVKRERPSRNRVDSVPVPQDLSTRNPGEDNAEHQRLRGMRRERTSRNRVGSLPVVDDHENDSTQENESTEQHAALRRQIRSQYLKVINQISEKRDDIASVDSDNFTKIIGEVDDLHQKVKNPREQVADAEALLDITNTLITSVKSHSSEGVTPAEFISCLVAQFGNSATRVATQENAHISLNWKDIGFAVSPVFRKCPGCCTMLGPMSTELRQRKAVVHRRRATKPSERARPEEVDNKAEEKTDTDKNMSAMFEILRRKKRVRLECLIFNRQSFAQTIENLFALSFLAKDGRVEITIDKDGSHHVSPRNAPSADSVRSREVIYSHFVFRFDYEDWKLMMDVVPNGEELMPHREMPNAPSTSQMQIESEVTNSQGGLPTTPIRKLSRNRGLVVQEDTVIEDSPEVDVATKDVGLRRSKRKLI